MNSNELLRIVDAIHRDKGIEQDIVFEGIEQAIISAARKVFGEEAAIDVNIDRDSGGTSVAVDGDPLNADEIGDLLGRIAAQTAKQVMIQKIREAERDALYEEFSALEGQVVSGTISQVTGGAATVNLGKVEGLLPRSEQIPGETHRVGERVRCVILEVKKAGSRVKIILSRTHPELVRRLFELEIPEVAEHVIEVKSLAREAGYRSKVAVTCYDSKVDAVGACVGVRGARIRSIVDELAGERIDIVRWNDSLQVLVPNALQPAEVEDVILCPMLGKVIVLVRDDQLSLAIGKKGQNVRLASKLVGWDIHVLTQEKLDVQLDKSVAAFSVVPGISDELAENLVAQGFFTFDDLSVIEPDQLAELGGLTPEECDKIVAYADVESERLEEQERQDRELARLQREEEALLKEMHAGRPLPAEPAHEQPAAAAPGEPAVEAGEGEPTVELAEAATEPVPGVEVEETAPAGRSGEVESAEASAEPEPALQAIAETDEQLETAAAMRETPQTAAERETAEQTVASAEPAPEKPLHERPLALEPAEEPHEPAADASEMADEPAAAESDEDETRRDDDAADREHEQAQIRDEEPEPAGQVTG